MSEYGADENSSEDKDEGEYDELEEVTFIPLDSLFEEDSKEEAFEPEVSEARENNVEIHNNSKKSQHTPNTKIDLNAHTSQEYNQNIINVFLDIPNKQSNDLTISKTVKDYKQLVLSKLKSHPKYMQYLKKKQSLSRKKLREFLESNDLYELVLLHCFHVAFEQTKGSSITPYGMNKFLNGYKVSRAYKKKSLVSFRIKTLEKFARSIRNNLSGKEMQFALHTLLGLKALRGKLEVRTEYFQKQFHFVNILRKIYTRKMNLNEPISIEVLSEQLGVKLSYEFKNQKLTDESLDIILNSFRKDLRGRLKEIAEREYTSLMNFRRGFDKKAYSINTKNLSEDNWQHLDLLKPFFREFRELTMKGGQESYPNSGPSLTNQFKQWVVNTYPYKRTALTKMFDKIYDKESNEIISFALSKIKNSALSLNDIIKEIDESGIYLSHHALRDIYMKYYFKENKKKYIERFPQPSDLYSEETREKLRTRIIEESLKDSKDRKSIRSIAEEFEISRSFVSSEVIKILTEQEAKKLWIANRDIVPIRIRNRIRRIVKSPYPPSLSKICKRFKVSDSLVKRIAKEENSKNQFENKWPAYPKIPDAVIKDLIRDIKNTNLNRSALAKKHKITAHSVSRYARKKVFKNDEKGYSERFPHIDYFELGTNCHNCITDLLTYYFNQNFRELYFAEPQIYPNSKSRTDGLILNNENFLDNRVKSLISGEKIWKLIFPEYLKRNRSHYQKIKAIQFDFTNDITDENLIDKIKKYEAKNLFLFIVGTNWYLFDEYYNLRSTEEIKFPMNYKIISASLFMDFMKLSENDKNSFNTILNLNANNKIKELGSLHENFEVDWHLKGDLRDRLKELGLIRHNLNEYFQLFKKRKGRQMKLTEV